LITFLSPEISASLSINVPFFLIITEYDVRLIVRDGSVDCHWLVP
jgi:hypothetical protein